MPTDNEYIRISDDGYLELRKKLSDQGRSSTGKSTIMLTSHGFQPIPDTENLAISLTVTKRSPKSNQW
jgi:hypothetical protein